MKKIWKLICTVPSKLNKYWVTVIFFAVMMFWFSDYTVIDRIRYGKEIKRLESAIEQVKKEKKINREKIDALQNGVEGLEKIAREQYQMSEPEEDVFIIKE
jgi:cell division protein FtsB